MALEKQAKSRHAVPPLPKEAKRARVTQYLIVLGLLAVTALCLVSIPVDLGRVISGFQRNFMPLVRGFTHPSGKVIGLATQKMLESFYMAVIGTGIGAVLALPFSFVASANLVNGRVQATPGKAFLVAIRTFPELLLAIIFVASLGPGALAGIMALGIHSIGYLGRIFSDIIESIDPGPSEALRATGASPLHVFIYAVIPQVMPEVASNTLYRFEINLRASAILGIVGAGGIGVTLIPRIQLRHWEEISTILIVIICFVIVVDTISGFVRRRLV
jgi:phosphonate transport system permease protein